MEIIPNGSEGRMKLRAPDGETVWAQARIDHASTPGSGRQKVRVVAGCLEITCDHAGRIAVKAVHPHDRIASVDEIDMRAFLHVMSSRGRIALGLAMAKKMIGLGSITFSTPASEMAAWEQTWHNLEAPATYCSI
jgi:hypothetical protein